MYAKPTDLMQKYSISRSMVRKIIREMQETKRYPKAAIIGTAYCLRIDTDCFQDYFENMEYLRHPNMRKYVEEYKKGG